MTYGIKVISTLDYQVRGIRKANNEFVAINGSDSRFFKTLNGAIKYLAKRGYTAFGEAL